MGLYDRDYVRDDDADSGYSGGRAGEPARVIQVIFITAAVFLADWLFFGERLKDYLELQSDLLQHPWNAYQLLTYGFLHADVRHILFNMIGLFFFGRDVEQRVGRNEFTRFYLAAIVFSGLAWLLVHLLTGQKGSVYGASGGVSAVVILFALHFPRAQVSLFGIIPMPAWGMALLFIGMDLLGALGGQRDGDPVAYEAHLAGAAFAYLYFTRRWSFANLSLGKFMRRWSLRRPKLKLFKNETPEDLAEQVDRILQKMSEQGADSLTRAERNTLEQASRHYQQRKP